MIESLKVAFAEDRLTNEELDARVGQALAARTYADLAVVTADITAGPNAGQPRVPVRARSGLPVSSAAKAGIAVAVAVAVPTVLAFATSIPPAFLFVVSFFFMALLAGVRMLISRDEQRSRAQLPLSFRPATPCP